jgi:hypothetical protein
MSYPPDHDSSLDELFDRYRKAVEVPHGVNFMPQLWGRIELRQRRVLAFRHIAHVFMTAAAGLSLAFGGVLAFQNFEQQQQMHSKTYIEILTSEHASVEAPDLAPFPGEESGR